MTNLLFSILTVLVTNVSEIQAPTRSELYTIILPSYPPQYPPPAPKTMSRYTTCHRITNAVARFGDVTLDKELGRELLWSTTEDFVEVTTWKSQGVRTNDYSCCVTNGMRYGIQFNTNLFSVRTNELSLFFGNTISNLTITNSHWNTESNRYTLEGR